MNGKTIKLVIRQNFISGLFVLAPLLIVLIVFRWVFGGLFSGLNQALPDQAGGVKILILLGLMFAGILSVSLLGFFSKLYLGRRLLVWLGEAIERIPIFGTIYSSLEQLMKTFGSSGGKQFSRVVFVEYPRKEVWAVGFVTGPSTLKAFSDGYLNVFVPTVPNPTSGFHLLVKEADIRESGLKVDEAFKLILSLGVAQPHG
jgi:uncharacterized membrane protein